MWKSLTPLFAAAFLFGCGAAPADVDETEALEVSVDQFVVSPEEKAPPRDPNDPFFANHPRTGTFKLSNGRVVEVPWRAQDIDWWATFGTADAAAMETLLKGTGYRPLTTVINGKRRGIVRVQTLNYRDSDDGPYRAFLLCLDVYKDEGGPAKTFPWVNAYSVLTPHFMGSLMYLYRGSVTGSHERTGRELLGFDKRKAPVLFNTKGPMNGNQVREALALDEHQRAVSFTRWQIDGSPAAQLAEANLLAQSLGLPDASHLPPTPPEGFQAGVSKDPMRPGHIKYHDGWAKWHTVTARWKPSDVMQFSSTSEFGRVGRALDIKPEVLFRDDHGKMTLLPDLKN